MAKCKKGYVLKNGKCKPQNKLKCFHNNIKKEWKKKKILSIAVISIIVLAFIIIPTGIDDAFTSLPLFLLLGWKIYIILLFIIIVILIIFFKPIKDMFKKITRGC